MECIFKYKCRMCNEVFDGPHGGNDTAMCGLLATVFSLPYPDKFIGMPPKMYDIHTCKNGDNGVGDLMGYSKNELSL